MTYRVIQFPTACPEGLIKEKTRINGSYLWPQNTREEKRIYWGTFIETITVTFILGFLRILIYNHAKLKPWSCISPWRSDQLKCHKNLFTSRCEPLSFSPCSLPIVNAAHSTLQETQKEMSFRGRTLRNHATRVEPRVLKNRIRHLVPARSVVSVYVLKKRLHIS